MGSKVSLEDSRKYVQTQADYRPARGRFPRGSAPRHQSIAPHCLTLAPGVSCRCLLSALSQDRVPLKIGVKVSLEDGRSYAQTQRDHRSTRGRYPRSSTPRHHSISPDSGKPRYAGTRQSNRAHRKHGCHGEAQSFHGFYLPEGSACCRANEYVTVVSTLVRPVVVAPGVLVIVQIGGFLYR